MLPTESPDMKNLSKIALGTALGAALMFATKPGPSISMWDRYHGMGVLFCSKDGTGTVSNFHISNTERPVDFTGMCKSTGDAAIILPLPRPVGLAGPLTPGRMTLEGPSEGF